MEVPDQNQIPMAPRRFSLELSAVSSSPEHTILSPALLGPPPFLSLAENHHNLDGPCRLRVSGFGSRMFCGGTSDVVGDEDVPRGERNLRSGTRLRLDEDPSALLQRMVVVHPASGSGSEGSRAPTRKVDVRLLGTENSTSHGARPVHFIITMMQWIRTSRLSIKNSLSSRGPWQLRQEPVPGVFVQVDWM